MGRSLPPRDDMSSRITWTRSVGARREKKPTERMRGHPPREIAVRLSVHEYLPQRCAVSLTAFKATSNGLRSKLIWTDWHRSECSLRLE